MKFSLRQLQIFQLIAEHQRVSDAAKELHMSQSAASMGLAQLEASLGHPLFIRQGRRMDLTNYGLWLRPHVHEVLANCRTIEMGMSELDLVSGQIQLGVSQTPAEHLVPALFCQMDRSFPRLNLKLEVENTEHVIAGLLDYRYDLGIIEGRCDDERIAREVWCKDELVILASTQHPYSRQESTTLTQLELAQWILREPGAGTREIFDSSIHKYLKQLNVHREYEQVGVILALLVKGNYLGCLSRRSVEPWVESGQLKILNVPELSITREFLFIWRKQESDNPSRNAILKTAKSIVE
ncbi:LysR family transcriptional regulator [Teredinibacter haidensis]|uniref:LysR family transcriptional regulator n=1 Tax=Teredinibacter haidensis TaxID=2731755 RepID=UPI000948B737|nr:LysR family transcriptional regulator [Teredinibacter haidensis]